MVGPAHWRPVVTWAVSTYRLNARRACRIFGVSRRFVWYRSVQPDDALLRRRLHELTEVRLTHGAIRLHAMLRRNGLAINHRKVHRLCCEEGLQLKPRRRKAATLRTPRAVVKRPNERWAMDLMHDVLSDGRTIRVFSLVDVYTRECVALKAALAFRGTDVARRLSVAAGKRGGLPSVRQCDNGTEFTSTALDHWAYSNKVQLDFSRPSKAVDNRVCEALNGSRRREGLSLHTLASLDEDKRVLSLWRDDYNSTRPHKSLGTPFPVDFTTGGEYLPRRLSRSSQRVRLAPVWRGGQRSRQRLRVFTRRQMPRSSGYT